MLCSQRSLCVWWTTSIPPQHLYYRCFLQLLWTKHSTQGRLCFSSRKMRTLCLSRSVAPSSPFFQTDCHLLLPLSHLLTFLHVPILMISHCIFLCFYFSCQISWVPVLDTKSIAWDFAANWMQLWGYCIADLGMLSGLPVLQGIEKLRLFFFTDTWNI